MTDNILNYNARIKIMHKIFTISILSFVLLFSSCNSKKEESKQYRLNIVEDENKNIDIKSRKFNAINLIKSSSFTTYPNITIEQLISAFNTVEWHDFIAEDDYMRYIDLIGKYGTNQYIIQFQIIDPYRWDLYAFEINSTTYSIDKVSSELYNLYTNK